MELVELSLDIGYSRFLEAQMCRRSCEFSNQHPTNSVGH